jgi:hypothetical protein
MRSRTTNNQGTGHAATIALPAPTHTSTPNAAPSGALTVPAGAELDPTALLDQLVAAIGARTPPATAAALLLTQEEAWGFLGVSRSAWFRLRSADKLPAPVEIPGVGQRWRRRDLEGFVAKLRPSRRRRPPVGGRGDSVEE